MSYRQEITNLMPGMGATAVSSYRRIWAGAKTNVQYLPGGGVIDGSKSRDPGNTTTGDVETVNDPTSVTDTTTLRAGVLMGKITASGKYAPSVLDLLAADVGGAQTTLKMSAAGAVELVRRVGSTGTFKLTGPAVSGSTVRTKTVTYSAVNQTTGAVTITALAAAAVNAVNQIEALPVVDASGASNTFTLTIEGITTAAITYSATVGTLITRVNAALDAAFGTSAIVASGANLAGFILTFSGTGYSGRPIVGHVTVTEDAALFATGTTIGANTTASNGASTTTALGVTAVAADEGEFYAGSLIQPTDGSETIKTFVDEEDGIRVTFASTAYDIQFPHIPLAGGVVDVTGLVNYSSADTAVQSYIKTALKAVGPFIFSDDL